MPCPIVHISQILEWADAHYARTGKWPKQDSGPVFETVDTTWCGITKALRNGNRGLPGGSTLPRLLERKRGVRNHLNLPRLTIKKILAWADAHRRRTGNWPTRHAGPVHGQKDETWWRIDTALHNRLRGLRTTSSLAQLLTRYRGVGHYMRKPPFTERQILAWVEAYHKRTGQWPKADSATVPKSKGETWYRVEYALRHGTRGLRGGSSLAKLIAARWGLDYRTGLRPLKRKQIVQWTLAHHRRTGRWPTQYSGPIVDAPGEAWRAVDTSLRDGRRGLRGGSSLSRLIKGRR